MKKYYANYVSLLIQEVDFESETDKTVLVTNGVKAFRIAKDTQSGSYNDTRDAAKEKLSAYIEEKIARCERQIKFTQDAIFTLKQSASKL